MTDWGTSSGFTRRTFLKATGSLTLGLYIGEGYTTPINQPTSSTDLPGSLRHTPQIQAWIKIFEDSSIHVYSGKVELGQGIRIAIKQVAAEELCQDLDQITIVLAETGVTPDEGYTAGSGSIQNSAVAIRYAAAAAKQRLLQMASEKLSRSIDQLQLVNGAVKTQDQREQISFYQLLVGNQIEENVALPVELVPVSARRFVGKSVSREDMGKIVTGQSCYINDLYFPDMLHARVLRPHNYSSQLIRFDEETFRKAAKGLKGIVKKGRFLAALTTTEYEAEHALKLLETYSEWTTPAIFPDQPNLAQHIRGIADAPKVVEEKGNTASIKAAQTLKASYAKPYTMHAALGTACSIALYKDDRLHVWTHSQGIYPLRRALSSMLDLPEAQLHLISVPGAGCFGHTVADDAAADAAIIAMQYPGKHIRVQWTRQDEHTWEPYGSAMLMDLEAGLDHEGKIAFWRSDVWSDSHSQRPNQDAGTLLAARHLDPPIELSGRGYLGGGHRNADPYYDIPNMKVSAHFFEGPLRVSSLRSLGAYANIFAIESFMDELAEAANQDPIEFRLKHLTDARAKEVVSQLAKLTKNEELVDGEGIGYAFCRYKNHAAYCAVAAKVWVDPTTQALTIRKLWATVDVGEVINPDGLKNQCEGGMNMAVSWTLKEAVTFDTQKITSKNWISYPTLSMGESPEMEVTIISRPDQPPMGGGEMSVPPTPAAITNAIYRACGMRVYELPIKL